MKKIIAFALILIIGVFPLVMPSSLAVVESALTWNIETVDSGYVGRFSSIALDSRDNPHISYYNGFLNRDLKYARWNGSVWSIEDVDPIGEHSSLVLDSSDNPHISYYDWAILDLKYAYAVYQFTILTLAFITQLFKLL